MDFRSFCMLETESLRTALARLNQAAKKVLFLTDAAGHLTAALTDGDVRRHLLSGGTLEDSAANARQPSPYHRHRQGGGDSSAGPAWLHCCAGAGWGWAALWILCWKMSAKQNPTPPSVCRGHHGGRQGHAP